MKDNVESRFRRVGQTVRNLFRSNASNVNSELSRISRLPRHERAQTMILGHPLTIYCPRIFPGLYREIVERGIYTFNSEISEPVVIDAGANIGLSTLAFKIQYPDADITAVEALPDLAAVLNKNLLSFGFDDVRVINKALSSKNGTCRFSCDPNGTAGHLDDEEGTVEVELITLSELIGDKSIDFLKLDIEGAEYDVLEEAREQLTQVKNLFIELHSRVGKAQRIDEALRVLKSAGFRYSIESGGPKSRQPFLKTACHKGMDVLLNVSASRTT